MFERFTEEARQVVVRAQEEARGMKHSYIGTEHLLLGLIREDDGIAARILRDAGAIPPRVRQVVLEAVSDPARARPSPVARFGAARRAGVDPAWFGEVRESLEDLGSEIRRELHRDPDSGDLLLALGSAADSPGARALAELGVDLDALAAAVDRHRTEDSRAREANLAELRRRLGLRGS